MIAFNKYLSISFGSLLLMIMMVCMPIPAYADIGGTVNSAAAQADKAADNPKGDLGQALVSISNQFKDKASKWSQGLKGIALWLFFTLGAISIVWTLVDMVVRQGNIGDIFAELTKFCVVFGLFLFFVEYGDKLAIIIFRSFERAIDIANQSTASAKTPIEQIDLYIHAITLGTINNISKVTDGMGIDDIVPLLACIIFLGFFAIVMFFVLALALVEIVMTQITLWILLYAGVLILGFGGCKWGRTMAVSYFKQVMSVSASYMCMMLIVLTACSFLNDSVQEINQMIAKRSPDRILASAGSILNASIMAFLCLLLMYKVPMLFGQMFGAFGYSGAQGTMRPAMQVINPFVNATATASGAAAGLAAGAAGGIAGNIKGASDNARMAYHDSITQQETKGIEHKMGKQFSSSSGSSGSAGSPGAGGKSSQNSNNGPSASAEKYYGNMEKGKGSFIQTAKSAYSSANSATRSAANEEKIRQNSRDNATAKAAYEASGSTDSIKTSKAAAAWAAGKEFFKSEGRAILSPIARSLKSGKSK